MPLRFRANRWLNGDNRLPVLPFPTLKSSLLSNWTIFLKGSWWKGRLLNRSEVFSEVPRCLAEHFYRWLKEEKKNHALFPSVTPLGSVSEPSPACWLRWLEMKSGGLTCVSWSDEIVGYGSSRFPELRRRTQWGDRQVRPCLRSWEGHVPCVNCKYSQNGAPDRLLLLIADTHNADQDNNWQKFG